MNYAEILHTCSEPAVGSAVHNALIKLFDENNSLLVIDIAERTIAAKIANYLQPYFPDYEVDVEYNRMGEVPKQVSLHGNGPLDKVFPDIIVHKPMTKTNILAIELKKESNTEQKDDDILKLRAYVEELEYKHALFIRLGVKNNAGTVSECEWVCGR